MLENTQKRNLSGFINDQPGRQQQQTSEVNQYYNNNVVYLSLFAINLVQRFPDVSNLEAIDANTVRSISRFAEACSKIVLEDHWMLSQQSQGQGQGQSEQIQTRRTA